jgi:hypothetical protein
MREVRRFCSVQTTDKAKQAFCNLTDLSLVNELIGGRRFGMKDIVFNSEQ